MNPTIRRATSDDIPVLVQLMREFHAEAGYSVDPASANASFGALLRDDSRGAVWILFHHLEPAGYVVLTTRFSMEYGGLDGFIDDLFVRPAYRRQSLGKVALETLLAECERRSILALHVEADRENAAAMALYGSYGLRDTGRQLLTVRLGNNPQAT